MAALIVIIVVVVVLLVAAAVVVPRMRSRQLQQRFGPEYERYRSAVPGWWPRLRPWTDADGPPAGKKPARR